MEEPLKRITKVQTILVVDDVASQLVALDSIFRREGFLVSAALSGEKALQVMKNTIIDAGVLDIEMPGMSGIELYKKMLADKYLRSIPVIFATADNSSGIVKEVISLGASGYVVKPYDKNDLIKQVRHALDTTKYDQGRLYLVRIMESVYTAAKLKERTAINIFSEVPWDRLNLSAANTLRINRLKNLLHRYDYRNAADFAARFLADLEEEALPSFREFNTLSDEFRQK